MDRRVALLGLLALSIALAGCDGQPCPPGETPIGDAATNASEEVAVGGSIVEFSASRIVLADGSGRALLVSLQGYDTDAASVGDCIVARGTVLDEQRDDYDVIIRTTSVEVRA